MIVKIVTKNDGCIVYDNFERVRYKTIDFKTAQELDADAKWLEELFKNDFCVLIFAKRRPTDEDRLGLDFGIVASGRVFLCNDQGQTIEKIN